MTQVRAGCQRLQVSPKLVVAMPGLPQHPPHHLPSQGVVTKEVSGCYSSPSRHGAQTHHQEQTPLGRL